METYVTKDVRFTAVIFVSFSLAPCFGMCSGYDFCLPSCEASTQGFKIIEKKGLHLQL